MTQHTVAVCLLYGLGGAATSPGITQLAEQIKQIPNVAVIGPYDQSEWQYATSQLKRYTVEKLVLIGYSMGANNVVSMANAIGSRGVTLMCCIQPTDWEGAATVPSTVDDTYEWYNPNFFETFGLGARRLTGHNVHYITNPDSHPYADNDPQVHNKILQLIRNLS